MAFTSSRRKKGRKVFYKSKVIRCTTGNSNVNSSKSNNFNISNSDNVIGNSNLPRVKVQTKSSFNTPITFQKETDTDSIISINYIIIDKKYISGEISSHHNSAELIDHTYDDNGKNLLDR